MTSIFIPGVFIHRGITNSTSHTNWVSSPFEGITELNPMQTPPFPCSPPISPKHSMYSSGQTFDGDIWSSGYKVWGRGHIFRLCLDADIDYGWWGFCLIDFQHHWCISINRCCATGLQRNFKRRRSFCYRIWPNGFGAPLFLAAPLVFL